jgi:CRP-like cAMP-binding protein
MRRLVAVAPALVILAVGTEPTAALMRSQVVLRFGLPFALVRLVWLTRRCDVIRALVNRQDYHGSLGRRHRPGRDAQRRAACPVRLTRSTGAGVIGATVASRCRYHYHQGMANVASLRVEVPFTEEELADLEARGSSVINRPRGTLLIGENEVDDHALLIRKGVVKIVAGAGRQIVYLRGPGEIVGEMASVRRKPRSASVVAMTDVQALHIPGARWIEFLVDHPRAAMAQIYALDERLAESTRKNVNSFLAAERKLAKTILELAGMELGEAGQQGTEFGFSQKDLAEIAGISVESAKDTISQLKARGVLRTGRMQIVIHDLDAIVAIAQGNATASG